MSPKFVATPETGSPTPRLSLPSKSHHSLSLRQSEGYMEQDDEMWQLQRHRHLDRLYAQNDLLHHCPSGHHSRELSCIPSCKESGGKPCRGYVFWQIFYEPSFTCLHEERIGIIGEGGKW